MQVSSDLFESARLDKMSLGLPKAAAKELILSLGR